MLRPQILVTLLLTGLIAACSGVSDRFPRLANERPALTGAQPEPEPEALPIPATGLVDVAPGDTVYALARRYGVTVRDVIDANQLEAPFRLQIGQTLKLPPPRVYTVVPGDTVYAISQRFDVDMRTLVSMNNLPAPYQLAAGRQLKMPVRPEMVATPANPGSVAAIPPVRAVPLPLPKPVSTARSRSSGGGAAPAATVTRTSARAVPPPPPMREGSRFLWPVRGRVISNFGPREGGLHNDGINIAAPKGAPILAADSGVVAYAGKELKGFGNLLLIKHSGGWTTAYAHADRLLVKRGDVVQRGQTIATIGESGGVSRPQLHFEIRRGARAVNPRTELET
jgi:murein DD-endopeptidase MepM/ murein hydrolase activator NlpD